MKIRAITFAYASTLRRKAARFRAALDEPEAASLSRLKTFLELTADSSYGREHRFGQIHSYTDFQRRVPIVTYEHLDRYVQRIASGENAVLTSAPVKMLERTSGSSNAVKLIPYTEAFLEELSSATGSWISDLFANVPALGSGQQYWSVSPVARKRETTHGGLPIGFEDDTEYFGPLARLALRQLLAVPPEVRNIEGIEQWRFSTLHHLLESENLALISVWSPSFLLLLMESLERQLEAHLAVLSLGRRRAVREGLARDGRLTGEALWPRLGLISCWADGPSAQLISRLRHWFPRTPMQPKGLLATEGVVSIPVFDAGTRGGLPALTSHFLELIDLEKPESLPVLAHQARVGGVYSPLISAANGFARYHLRDVLRCEGRYLGVPLLRFEGKLDQVSDLRGEKLHVQQVEAAIRRSVHNLGIAIQFALLAPVAEEPAHYRLFLESDASASSLKAIESALEKELLEGFHYRYCRDLGQLGRVSVWSVKDGWGIYAQTLTELGLKLGDIKPTSFDTRLVWTEAFRHGRPA